jgi:hypothetical protein
MSPEQMLGDAATTGSDQFSFCVAVFEALYGQRPFGGKSLAEIRDNVLFGDFVKLPKRDFPVDIGLALRRGLSRDPDQRFSSMGELLDALEQACTLRKVENSRRPFVGLVPFDEGAAGMFCGRTAEMRQSVARLEQQSILVVTGASGVGKSSVVQAGLFPELRRQGWQVTTMRPGREPLDNLAGALQELSGTGSAPLRRALADSLRRQPELLRTTLMESAEANGSRVAVFIDQFEELYTQGTNKRVRGLFLRCLLEAAKDPRSAIRIILSMRSDLLDNLAGDRNLAEIVSGGIVFLPAADRHSLTAALVGPVDKMGYQFESRELVKRIVQDLQGTSGALPLLQFIGEMLWESRDKSTRTITNASYDALGTITGALSRYADSVIAGTAREDKELIRAVFRRLVTADRTRNIVPMTELATLGSGRVKPILRSMVDARLLLLNEGAGGTTVELIHECLINEWPTLRKWLDQDNEDASFLDRLKQAARQWDQSGRPAGLVWRDEAAREAQYYARRLSDPLSRTEGDFMAAVIRLATRRARLQRLVVTGIIACLLAAVAAAALVVVKVNEANRSVLREAEIAQEQTALANQQRAKVEEQLAVIQEKERQRLEAMKREKLARQQAEEQESELQKAGQKLQKADVVISRTNKKLRKALKKEKAEAKKAKRAADRLAKLLAIEKKRNRERKKQRKLRSGTLTGMQP